MAQPWEKPASTIRRLSMPRSCSRASSARTCCSETRMPASSSRRARSGPTMSYQLRMAMPPLMVTGWMVACGKMKRTFGRPARSSWGTMGAKSLPSAPSPCSQITAHSGCGPVSISMQSSNSGVVIRFLAKTGEVVVAPRESFAIVSRHMGIRRRLRFQVGLDLLEQGAVMLALGLLAGVELLVGRSFAPRGADQRAQALYIRRRVTGNVVGEFGVVVEQAFAPALEPVEVRGVLARAAIPLVELRLYRG